MKIKAFCIISISTASCIISISIELCINCIREIIYDVVYVPLIIYSFHIKDIMNFNFLSNARKTNFNFSVINTKNLEHTLLTMSEVIDDS